MHAQRADDPRHQAELLWYLFWALEDGPAPVERAIAGCRELIEQAGDDRVAAAHGLATIGRLEALRGRVAEAHSALAEAGATVEELGLKVFGYQFDVDRGHADLLAGEYGHAERRLRAALDRAQANGFGGVGCATWLAQALLAQGRAGEAAEVAARVAEHRDTGDIAIVVRLRVVEAQLLAGRGLVDDAWEHADEAVRHAESSERLVLRGEALLAHEALACFERKGATVFAERARSLLSLVAQNDRGRR